MSVQFEWITVEEESEWRTPSLPPSPPACHSAWGRWSSPWLWALFGLLLLSIGGGVYALELSARAGWDATKAEVQNSAVADAWLARPATAAAIPTVQVVQIKAQGATQAVVQAVVTQTLASGETIAYRTTDIYRVSATGWQRVAPASAQLGPMQTLATRYFEIDYYAVDGEVVKALAPRLDTLYEQACASFGLSPCAATHRIPVELATDPRRAAAHWLRVSSEVADEVILLPSPLLLHLPVQHPAAEWLYQAAAVEVIRAVLRELIPNVRFGEGEFRWDSLLKALQLWQVWQAGGALAGERVEVLRQVYAAAPDAETIAACRVDLLLRLATDVFQICDEPAWQTAPVAGKPPLRPPRELMHPVAPQLWGGGLETVALETMVEYVVARYGVERLPRLVQALSDHASWQTLIPAVFGISADEFEAGWQAYIAAHYGTTSP